MIDKLMNLPVFEFIGKFNLPPALILVILFIPILPNLWCIWNAYRSEFPSPVEKMAWIIVGIFFPVAGGLLYIFAGARRAHKKQTLPEHE